MSKRIENKKQKREALLSAAFDLFTSKGVQETSISEIVEKSNLAKGTFYLYFKDKYDVRDRLIQEQARLLFNTASVELKKRRFATLEEEVIFIADSVIDKLNENKILLQFISKNLSWGVFRDMLVTGRVEDDNSFYGAYQDMIRRSGRTFRNTDLMLYMIVELISSTCHNVILKQEPVALEELKPELYACISDMIRRQEM